MKTIKWNIEKEARLLNDGTRAGIGFADRVIAIDDGRILDNLAHPIRDNQRLLVLNIEDYAYLASYVIQDDGSWFLKTVFPSRKHTVIYLMKKTP